MWENLDRVRELLSLIMPKIPEISVGTQMEKSVSVPSNRSIFDKPVLSPN